jgi:hypothetical protein
VSGFHHKIDQVIHVICRHIVNVHQGGSDALEMSKERVTHVPHHRMDHAGDP